MKKLLSCICFLFVFGCAGYEPIFLTKDLNFYINKIENIDDEEITKKIIRNIGSYKLEQKKINYSLEVSSKNTNEITSRDSKGDPQTYRITIEAKIDVFKEGQASLFNTINIKKDFTYNYQVNQFDLSQYKKDIIQNLTSKISEEIILKLQLM